MKKYLFLMLLLPTIAKGQVLFEKANDSTVYEYLLRKHSIVLDKTIPDTIDGYVRSPGDYVSSVEIQYRKPIDSFRLVGEDKHLRSPDFEMAITDGELTLDEKRKTIFINFFLTEEHEKVTSVLSYNRDTKTFVRKDNYSKRSLFPSPVTTSFLLVLLFLGLLIARDKGFMIHRNENKIFRSVSDSFLFNTVAGGISFLFVFSGKIHVPLDQRIVAWLVRWLLVFLLFLIFIRREKE